MEAEGTILVDVLVVAVVLGIDEEDEKMAL